MKLLAIPLGYQKTVTKWLVISQTRRTAKVAAPHTSWYASKIFRVQRSMATAFWILRQKNAPSQKGKAGGKVLTSVKTHAQGGETWNDSHHSTYQISIF